jgi:hypothetical protein
MATGSGDERGHGEGRGVGDVTPTESNGSVEFIVQGRTLVSKTNPCRAVQRLFAGWYVCYEAPEWVPGTAEMLGERVGLTDDVGAKQFLRGETPHAMYTPSRSTEPNDSVDTPAWCR